MLGVGIDGAVKTAYRHLIGIAGIHHHHFWVTQQCIPFGRRDIVPTGAAGEIKTSEMGGDDFWFVLDFETLKRHRLSGGIFHHKLVARGDGEGLFDAGEEGGDAVTAASQSRIDAFAGDQHSATEGEGLAFGPP